MRACVRACARAFMSALVSVYKRACIYVCGSFVCVKVDVIACICV